MSKKFEYARVKTSSDFSVWEGGIPVKSFERLTEAFNFLGEQGYYIKMQTKGGSFIFEREIEGFNKIDGLVNDLEELIEFNKKQIEKEDSSDKYKAILDGSIIGMQTAIDLIKTKMGQVK